MYDLLKGIINHTWQTGSNVPGDQQILYYMSSALVIIFAVVFIDLVYRLIRSIMKKGDF